jgi:hypothetical protein
MRPPDARASAAWQAFDASLAGLESELETKLRDVRRMRRAAWLATRPEAPDDVERVRAAVGQLERMLGTNRLVRDILVQLRHTALHLLASAGDARES